LKRLEGRLVVAVDDTGERYFKRLRVHGNFVVLESLNPDGTTPAQLLSLDGSSKLPKLTDLIEVVGVLFEAPQTSPKE
jgi:SOS-response transcriptional repressor LexA